MVPQAILFDLDGTLADTLAGIAQCMNDVLARYDLPMHEPDAYRRMIGDGITKLVERALPDDQRHRVEPFIAAYLPHLETHGTSLARLYEGVPMMLDTIVERRIPMGVYSNKPHDATAAVVGQLLDRWPWQVVRGHLADTPVKPDPTVALQLCGELGTIPGAMWYVGDSNVDMDLAAAAGFIGIGAAWGMRGRAELEAHGAAHVLDAPDQLPALLDT